MRNPGKVIQIVVRRNFPFRGQECFTMPHDEFEHRWARTVSDFADAGYPGCALLLEKEREKLIARWARMPEDFEFSERAVTHEPKKVTPIQGLPIKATVPSYMKPTEDEKRFRWKETNHGICNRN